MIFLLIAAALVVLVIARCATYDVSLVYLVLKGLNIDLCFLYLFVLAKCSGVDC